MSKLGDYIKQQKEMCIRDRIVHQSRLIKPRLI